MGCFGFLLLSLSFTLLQINLNTAQQSPQYAYHYCSGGNYTANSTFQSNLNGLLSSLSSNTTLNNTRFYNNTVGGRSNQDRVYGLFQCRGDVNFEVCKNCVQTVSQEITQDSRCPYRKEAILWYDLCMLRYSNNSFVSSMQVNPTIYLWNVNNVSDPDRFNPILASLMDGLVTRAVSDSRDLFATGDANFTDFNNLYGLVQCTQDITRNDCNRCLTGAVSEIPQCCDKKRGARVIRPSCNIRYEIVPFYEAESEPIVPVPPPHVPPLPNTNTTKEEKNSSRTVVIIVVPTVTAVVLLLTAAICFCLRRRTEEFKIVNDVDEISTAESLQFNFATVRAATENFSDANKVGEGGFGCVYKGKLTNGQEIAVKRLSRNSGQGVEEFKNEVLLVAQLQHRNLARLLGFCLEGEEKVLIYEFVPNTSLDHFIFDPIKRTYLDWERRYMIIGGIARGLLYLHEDSRERIIHRDLKASNILLDAEMNAKISDFGMARLFVMDQTQGSTKRIVGTYGYMAPEYAMHGQFSVKSDVFSFGVLVLEIVTGEKNNSFYQTERAQDLLSYVWRHWQEGTALELTEPTLSDRYSRTEVMRCIHIALLCVQEDVAIRPTMGSVELMLNSYSIALSLPSPPAFFITTNESYINTTGEHEPQTTVSSQFVVPDQPMSSSTDQSINEVSVTELYPR